MAFALRATEKVNCVTEDEELRKRGYVVGVSLGEGSYAKVKSALSEKLGRKVALKIINRRKAPKDFQLRFLPRELEVLKIIQHPNVVQMYEIMHFNGKVYIAMEIAGHGDLLEYIKLRGAIPEEKSRVMFQQLVDAVGYLHDHNIVHRDLKCENILLDCQNNIKVSDFGFARILSPNDFSKTFCGSAAYAAPEILQGIPYSGAAYDIWSMGVILYIMVCGSMPYDDSNIKKMIKYQTERKVGFSRHKKVSDDCKELIHLILEANVKQRATIGVINAHRWMEAPSSPPSTASDSRMAHYAETAKADRYHGYHQSHGREGGSHAREGGSRRTTTPDRPSGGTTPGGTNANGNANAQQQAHASQQAHRSHHHSGRTSRATDHTTHHERHSAMHGHTRRHSRDVPGTQRPGSSTHKTSRDTPEPMDTN